MLNTLGSEQLWSMFGISRVSQINGFDSIGLPVYGSTRPQSASISINSGKGLSAMMARAGTIAESIEFSYAEVPHIAFPNRTIDDMAHLYPGLGMIEPDRWHLARGAVLQRAYRYNWDWVSSLNDPDTDQFLLPVDLIYIAEVRTSHLMYFQSSTNGWATGANVYDAILAGLYEVVERDAWTLWRWQVERRNIWPPRIDLGDGAPWEWLQDILARLARRNLLVFAFDISTNTALPACWAILYDKNPSPGGVFSGFGCAGNFQKAIERAVLEAIQSRACYVAGARDDLLRRSFLMMKSFDQASAMKQMADLPASVAMYHPELDPTLSAQEELAHIRRLLAERGFTDFFFKNSGQPFKGQSFTVGKVYAPCLEQYYCPYWRPTKRFYSYVGSE